MIAAARSTPPRTLARDRNNGVGLENIIIHFFMLADMDVFTDMQHYQHLTLIMYLMHLLLHFTVTVEYRFVSKMVLTCPVMLCYDLFLFINVRYKIV